MKHLSSLPVWQLAFRPFFLLGVLFGILMVLVWIFILTGSLPLQPSLPLPSWHAYQMLFGFSQAFILGFLFTATQNWTGIRGVYGFRLQLIVLLWMIGRFSFLSANSAYAFSFMAIDLSNQILCGVLLWKYLGSSDQKRNRQFYLYLFLSFIGVLLIHLGSYLLRSDLVSLGILLGIYSVLFYVVVIAGRVVPFFTRNAIPSSSPAVQPLVEKASLWGLGALLVCELFFPKSMVLLSLSLIVGAIHFLRWFRWDFSKTFKLPILFILHYGYFWIVLGFFLKGFSILNWTSSSIAAHAWTIGGFTVLIYGMVTRVSLGHTARPILPTRLTQVGYLCIGLAPLFRVALPLIDPKLLLFSYWSTAFLWILAFSILLWVYAPILLKPRLDGKPG